MFGFWKAIIQDFWQNFTKISWFRNANTTDFRYITLKIILLIKVLLGNLIEIQENNVEIFKTITDICKPFKKTIKLIFSFIE